MDWPPLSPVATAIRPGLLFRRKWVLGTVVALVAWGLGPVSRAVDPQTDEAVEHVATLGSSFTRQTGGTPEQNLYQTIYWIWMATRRDISPESVLTLAAGRSHGLLSLAGRHQLLNDWHVASVYGLLTPENIARLKDGTPPTATDGRYVNQVIRAVAIANNRPGNDLSNLALGPEGVPLPPEAHASAARPPPALAAMIAPPPPRYNVSTPRPTPVIPPEYLMLPNGTVHRLSPGELSTPTPVPPMAAPAAMTREGVELHDVLFNDSLPIGRGRKLAVAFDSGGVLSVSMIGDGPKVWAPGPGSVGGTYYPKVENSKVPKVNPVRLPGIDGNAYLIYSEGITRFYYVDTIVNNGAAFRLAKVVVAP